MASAAVLLRLRGFPVFQARVITATLPRRYSISVSSIETPQRPDPSVSVREDAGRRKTVGGGGLVGLFPPSPPPKHKESSWENHPDYRRWKDKEEEILQDIEPVKLLTKDILHSERYLDGERLSTEDEKVVVEKLLAYHPHLVDKIGSGLDSIMFRLIDILSSKTQDACLLCGRTASG